MRLLFTALLTLVAAVLLARAATLYPGFVAIGVGEWVVQTTPVALLLGVVALVLVVWGGLRLLGGVLGLPGRMSRWSENRRREQCSDALTGGLKALAEGHFHEAEQLLLKGAARAEQPMLYYLSAAEAAQRQGAAGRREDYLRLAGALEGSTLAVGLSQASHLLEHRRFDQAREVLAQLRETAPRHPEVLRLTLDALLETGDWAGALDLLPLLRKARHLEPEDREALEQRVHTAVLDAAPRTPEAVHQAWKRLPRAAHHAPALLARHVRNLAEAGLGEEAEKVLRVALKERWDPLLVRLYARVDCGDARAQLDRAESWLRLRGSADPALLYTLGELCQRNGLWGQARVHFEAALAASPCPDGYQRLAEVLLEMGESEAATRATREGLRLASGPGSVMALLPAPAPGR